MPLVEMQLILNKNHNYSQIKFDLVDLSSLVVAISSPFPCTNVALSHHCRTQSHYSGTLQHTSTLTHRTRTFRHTIPTTFYRTTSAHFDAPNPHISSHRTRTFRRTVPRGTVAKRGSVTKRGLVENGIQFAKRGVQLRNGIQLQSRG